MSDFEKTSQDGNGETQTGTSEKGNGQGHSEGECCGNSRGFGGHHGPHGHHHGPHFHGRENAWWEDRPLPVKILMGIGFAILGIGLVILFVLVVMALWNWLMPEIFGLKQIDFLQTAGLLLLSTLLFKNVGGGKGGHSDRRRKQEIRKHLRETMKDSNPEA